MNTVQKNIVDKMSNVAALQLKLMGDFNSLLQMYAAENIGALTNVEMAELPELAHVSAAELQAAKGAMDTLFTALGNYAVGTPSAKLSKIIKNVP